MMRPHVSKIVIVYSTVSNFGEHNMDLAKTIALVEQEKLADVIVQYFPRQGSPHQNELAKRHLGLEQCQDCDVFMTMDCDEFYEMDKFKTALSAFWAGKFDSSACQMQTYYKRPDVRITPPEEYYVPLFYRVSSAKFILNQKWPVTADPTRKMAPGKMFVLNRHQLEMHHMSYVRKDIRRKLRNSSANKNFSARVEEIAAWHDGWKEGQQAYFAGKEIRKYDTEVVDNIFPQLINTV